MSKARACLVALMTAFAALGLGACEDRHHHHVITAKVIDTIRSGEVRWNEDLKSGDPNKVLRHYAADAVIMTPGKPPVSGAAALRAVISPHTGDPKYRLTWSSQEVQAPKSGEFAIAKGIYTLTTTPADGSDPRTTSGTYVDIYRPAADGRWLVAWQITAPSEPDSASPP